MDRALLERMVGAVALVLLLVIVAPALLDGTSDPDTGKFANTPDEDVRTQVIVLNEPRILELPEAAASPDQVELTLQDRPVAVRQPEKPKTPVVTRARQDRPAPAESSPAPVTPKTAQAAVKPSERDQPVASPKPSMPAPAIPKPAPETPAVARTSTAVSSEFAVQLGSFSQLENARKYAAEIGTRGFAVFVRSTAAATGSVHRVYAGPRPNRDAAAKLAAVLGAAGYKGMVVEVSGNGDGGR